MKFFFVLFLGLVGAIGIVSTAGAFFTSQGTGTGSGNVSSLIAPTNVIATFPNPSVRTVDVSWTAPTEPAGIVLDGYYVQRYLGSTPSPACGSSPNSLVTTVTCDDTNVPSGTYTYTVTAVFNSWTAPSAPSAPVTVAAPQLSSFTLDPSNPTPTAGTGYTVAITALDQYGNVDTAYTGPECLTFSGPVSSLGGYAPIYPGQGTCSSGSEVTFVDGVATGANSAQVTLFDAQTVTLTATDNPTSVDGTTVLNVLAGSVSTFGVANPGTQTAGVAFGDTITALDGYGNVVTAYTGAQSLVFTGPSNSQNDTAPTYPGSVTFTDGVGSASGIILVDAQMTDLTATQGSLTGTSTDFLVVAGPVTEFSVANPGSQTVGVAFGDTITALDTYGNVVTAYTGAQDLVFSGPSNSPNSTVPTYPASVTFTNGVGKAAGITLVDAQTTTLTATQSTLTGTSSSFVVSAGSANYYSIGVPPAATVGVPFSVTITAFDADGNVATGYDGTADLVPTTGAISPVSVTLVNGTVTFNASLDTAGNQTITATDSTNSSLTRVSGVIVVTSGTSNASYTVTYNAGAATSGTAPSDSNSPYTAGSTVTVLANSGNLAETGYTFSGWNTQANGSGTTYSPGSTFTISANTELYPVFSANAAKFTVTYNAGAATSGTAPSDSNSPYTAGSTVTVLANSGNLAETGYTFSGWNTQANGSGTTYSPGSTFTISANTELYPVFSANAAKFTVTYNAGAATSGTAPSDSNSPYTAGSTVTVLANSGNLAETGYTFSGWNTQANGSGTTYSPGSTFTISANTELYPVFSANAAKFTVTYNAGAATSGTAPSDSNSPYTAGSTVTVLANSGNLAETGYTFSGWNTQANGSGTTYSPGSTFTISANTELYPVFSANAAKFTVTYNAGAATSGTAPSDSNSPYTAGSTVTVLANSGNLAETGYTFSGWNTQANGSGTTYSPGSTFTISANTELYPVFTANAPTITTTSLPGATIGQTNYSATLQGTGGTTPYAWSISTGILPKGLTLNSSTGAITGTVSSQASTEIFTVTLKGANGATTSKQFTITVCGVVQITTTSLPGATIGQTNYAATLQGTGGTTPYTWLISAGILPKGLTLNSSTGAITGTVSSQATTETFTVALKSANGATATKQFTVTVCVTYAVTYSKGTATSGTVPVDSNSPYTAGSTVTVLANSGNLAETGYTFSGWNTQANGSGTTYSPGSTFTISANTELYPVFSANAAKFTVTYNAGAATSGTAPSDSNSPYTAGSTVTVLANSGNLAETGYTFSGWNTQANGSGTTYSPGSTFTISANTELYPVFTANAPTITTTSLPGATIGQTNYSATLQGTGGTTPYAWSISTGILPKGLTLNSSTGAITGTVSSQASTEIFTVTLKGANGATTSKQFTVTVCGALQITTNSLGMATIGQNYSVILQGTGGTIPYSWSISAGLLPKGLTLNSSTGAITGSVSSQATTETFTVTLTSANGATTTKQFTISICRQGQH